MNDVESTDDELRALLRSVDPARALLPLRADAVSRVLDPARFLAAEDPGARRQRRSSLTWAAAAAAVVLIAATGVSLGLAQRHDGAPTREAGPGPATSGPPSAAPTRLIAVAPRGRCMMPSVTLLRSEDLALEGTVTSVAHGVAIVQPDRVYAGDPGDTVRVSSPAHEEQQLLQAVRLQQGSHVLLAADEGHVLGCGSSGPYSADLASLYAKAF